MTGIEVRDGRPELGESGRLGRTSSRLGLYLGGVQLVLLLTWTVYAVYLPGLLGGVGLDPRWVGWILLADQLLFACFDVLAGFMADRAFRLYARIGYPVMAATAVSCTAFVALPLIPGLDAGPEVFLGVVALWIISSAALRSPLFALLSRHAATPEIPRLAGLALVGMGLAAAASPYLGGLLETWDPRLPFVLSGVALLLTAGGLVLAERRYRPPPVRKTGDDVRRTPVSAWLPAILLAALATQVAVFINAGPRYLREIDAAWLPWLLPVFWAGFSLAAFSGGRLAIRSGPARPFVIGCGLSTLGAAGTLLPGLVPAACGYALAGLGWGLVLPSAFGLAAASSQAGRAGFYMGLVFAAIALAALLRIGMNLSGLPTLPDLGSIVAASPPLLWLASGILVLAAGVLARRA